MTLASILEHLGGKRVYLTIGMRWYWQGELRYAQTSDRAMQPIAHAKGTRKRRVSVLTVGNGKLLGGHNVGYMDLRQESRIEINTSGNKREHASGYEDHLTSLHLSSRGDMHAMSI